MTRQRALRCAELVLVLVLVGVARRPVGCLTRRAEADTSWICRGLLGKSIRGPRRGRERPLLVVCTAVGVDGWSFAQEPLRGLAAAAVVVRTGAPRLVATHTWRSATAGAEDPLADFGASLLPLAGDEAAVEDRGCSPEELAEALDGLDGWLGQLPRSPEEALLVSGFAAAHDLAYLLWAYARCGRVPPFAAAPLDLRSLALGALGLGWEECAPARLQQHLPLPRAAGEAASPLAEEARTSALLLVQLFERLRRRAASELAFR